MDMRASAQSKKYPTSMEIYADKNVNYKTPQEALEFLRSRFGDAVT